MSGSLAHKIKGLIDSKDLSVQGLEKKAGLKINAVRNILTGHSKKPSAETLLAVAKALDCSISDLLEEESPHKRKEAFKDMKFSNHTLLSNITTYIIKVYGNHGEDLSSRELMTASQEIYTYSCENNNGVFDEKFAKWLLDKHFC